MPPELHKTIIALLAASFLTEAAPARASQNCTDDAMIVFDGSGSMAEMGFNGLNSPRIVEARRAMERSVPQIAAVRKLGLITYGPGRNAPCHNIALRFAPMPDAASAILNTIDQMRPSGNTPLTHSVRQAAEVLDYRNKSGAIVLVTDGKETCAGSPCQLAAELAADSANLTIHVVGFQVRGDFFAWRSQGEQDYENGQTVARCLADRTGGEYVSTETAEELARAMEKTLGCAVIGANTPPRHKVASRS